MCILLKYISIIDIILTRIKILFLSSLVSFRMQSIETGSSSIVHLICLLNYKDRTNKTAVHVAISKQDIYLPLKASVAIVSAFT